MNLQQLRARVAEIRDEMRAIADTDPDEVTDDQEARFDELQAELEGTDDERGLLAQIEREESRAAVLERATRASDGATEAGSDTPPSTNRSRGGDDPFDLRSLPFNASRDDLRARATTAVEQVRGLDDTQRAAATELLERHDNNRGALARHMLATGRTEYRTGWQKLVAGRSEEMTDAERRAIAEARAMSLADAAGGHAVPFTLDPTIISTKDVSTNPVRRLANVKTTVTNAWNGVTSSGMEVSWDGEAQEVSDDSPTLGPAPIPVHKAQGFAIGSIEISQDWAGIESDLRDMIQEAKDDAEGIAFTVGSGTNMPTGVVTALAGTASELAPATAETFAVGDLYRLEEALPPKYRLAMMDGQTTTSRASWLAARGTYNTTREFGTSDSHALWVRLGAGLPPELIGYRAYEASAMDSARGIDASTTAANRILTLGDFRNYVVVDRVGLTVEFIPHVFGGNGRPTGQRGWYAFWRVGGDVVNNDAFRQLNVATAV